MVASTTSQLQARAGIWQFSLLGSLFQVTQRGLWLSQLYPAVVGLQALLGDSRGLLVSPPGVGSCPVTFLGCSGWSPLQIELDSPCGLNNNYAEVKGEQ